MRFVLLILIAAVVLAACPASLSANPAAASCPGFGGDKAFDALVATLSADTSCQHARATLHDCAWGSSADTSFAPIVAKTCEKGFFSKLTPTAKLNYEKRMQMCAFREALQQGTMYMSAAALCQADVAADFDADPAKADVPVHASFDCTKAHTTLERAICGDDTLGQADIILADAYKGALASVGDGKNRLVEQQRRWLASLQAACRLQARDGVSRAAIACATTAFEKRFTSLDDCENTDCSASTDIVIPSVAPRASFDCQKPGTALEITICADADLGKADIALAAAYREAQDYVGVAGHDALVASERRWLHFAGSACPLGVVGSIPSVWARACVRSTFETRIEQLRDCPKRAESARAACLDDFRVLPKS